MSFFHVYQAYNGCSTENQRSFFMLFSGN